MARMTVCMGECGRQTKHIEFDSVLMCTECYTIVTRDGEILKEGESSEDTGTKSVSLCR